MFVSQLVRRGGAAASSAASRAGFFRAPLLAGISTSPAARGEQRAPTAVVMMNLGGPETLDKVQPFLENLFSDREIMQLGPPWLQKRLGPKISERRTPGVQEQYAQIGGGSPILKWTTLQGEALVKELDARCPETAPHKLYVAFRYADPMSRAALEEMKADGVKRAVAFTQYPQYSCTTTGSSLNQLWRDLGELGLRDEFEWSVIDRWGTQPKFVEAIAANVRGALEKIPDDVRKDAVVLFSAHSLPMKVIDRGDPYPAEVAATVNAVMERLGFSHAHRLVWQSQVGPMPWLGMQTEEAIKGFGGTSGAHAGRRPLVVVPIAFTSDHIETLFELDIEYGEVAEEAGVEHYIRAESLNDNPAFLEAQADLVEAHLKSGATSQTPQHLALRCPTCVNEHCGESKHFWTKNEICLSV